MHGEGRLMGSRANVVVFDCYVRCPGDLKSVLCDAVVGLWQSFWSSSHPSLIAPALVACRMTGPCCAYFVR